MLGGEARIDPSHLAVRDPGFEVPRDALDPRRRPQFVQHMRQLRKPARLGDDHAVQRQRLRRQRHLEHVLRRLPQSIGEVGALEQRRVEGRGPALDEPPHDRLEQHLLAGKAVIERALRDAGALGDPFDAGRAKAVAQEQRRRDIEDAVRELRGFLT